MVFLREKVVEKRPGEDTFETGADAGKKDIQLS
jgi:hypothetical protein